MLLQWGSTTRRLLSRSKAQVLEAENNNKLPSKDIGLRNHLDPVETVRVPGVSTFCLSKSL